MAFDLLLEPAHRYVRVSRARAPAPHKTRGYNNLVPASPPPDQPSQRPTSKPHICRLEAAGILIIGAVVLMLILTRYWHHIAWGAR